MILNNWLKPNYQWTMTSEAKRTQAVYKESTNKWKCKWTARLSDSMPGPKYCQSKMKIPIVFTIIIVIIISIIILIIRIIIISI